MDTGTRGDTLPLVNLEPLTSALGVLAVVAYVLVLYWAIVAYLEALALEDRRAAERWLVVVGGLLVLSILAVVYGSEAVRVALVGIAGYLIARGPFARRT
jgi:hypothetical protein